MLQLHRTPHQGHLTGFPVLAQHAESGAFSTGCVFDCFPALGSARHTTVVSSKGPPSDGGVVALRLKPFSPHYLWPSCPTYVGCPGASSMLPHHELLYKRKERRFLPGLKALGIRAKNIMTKSGRGASPVTTSTGRMW
jgi:hypothetical protein